MLQLEHLSFKESLLISDRAERLWRQRLEQLQDRVRPLDSSLADALSDLEHDEELHGEALARMDEGTPMPTVWHLDQGTVDGLLLTHFPALMSPARPKPTRPNVLALVDAVENECIRFYQELARCCANKKEREFFARMAELEEEHKERVPVEACAPGGV